MKVRLFFTLFTNILLAWGLFVMGTTYNNPSAIPFVFLGAILLTVVNWAIWNLDLKQNTRSSKTNDVIEKKKHDRLDSVLRDLSDSDLLRLKQRLTNGTISDEQLEAQLMDSDGELHYRGQQ